MEIQLEMKKKKVIDKAIEAQEEAVTRLLNYRRSSSGNAALAAEPPPVVLTGANHAVTSGEQSASAHAQMPEPGGDDGGDKDDPHDPHDTQHVAASQGPESGGESREDVSDLPSSKPQPPTSSGSNGPASMKGAPPPGGWPEVSNDQRRAMRQSRDKPWTAVCIPALLLPLPLMATGLTGVLAVTVRVERALTCVAAAGEHAEHQNAAAAGGVGVAHAVFRRP